MVLRSAASSITCRSERQRDACSGTCAIPHFSLFASLSTGSMANSTLCSLLVGFDQMDPGSTAWTGSTVWTGSTGGPRCRPGPRCGPGGPRRGPGVGWIAPPFLKKFLYICMHTYLLVRSRYYFDSSGSIVGSKQIGVIPATKRRHNMCPPPAFVEPTMCLNNTYLAD